MHLRDHIRPYRVRVGTLFVAIILVDVFILPDFLGYSVFSYVMGILHEKIALILLLGT